jgi:hypothetical protein
LYIGNDNNIKIETIDDVIMVILRQETNITDTFVFPVVRFDAMF